jgi:hypothetical protein
VDLASGSWRVAGEFGGGWLPLVGTNRHVPQPILKRYGYLTRDVGWFDGDTGLLRKVLPHDVRTPDVLEWQRASMPAVASHRDRDGRAVWMEDEHVVREGESLPLPRWIPGKPEPWYVPIPGGWSLPAVTNDNPRRMPTNVWRLWDADTGQERTVERSPNRTRAELLLSPRTALRRSYRPAPRTARQELDPWTLVDLESGAVLPTTNPPADEALLAALPGERALFMARTEKWRFTLSVWDPRSGETTPVLDERGEPFVGRSADRWASAPGGLSVFLLWPGSARPFEAAFALLDESRGTARRLPIRDFRCEIVCIESPDSLVAITYGEKVVRFRWETAGSGPAGFREETLFPRPGGARTE